jgi:hypothetical protein
MSTWGGTKAGQVQTELKYLISSVFSRNPNEEAIGQISLIKNAENPSEKSTAILYLLDRLLNESSFVFDEFPSGDDELISSYQLRSAYEQLREIGLLNFVSLEEEIWLDPDGGINDALYGSYKVWLTPRGKEVGRELHDASKKSIAILQRKKDERDQKFATRTTEANKEKIELDAELEKQGGAIRKGLYHGNRRVRAKIDLSDWVISSDETDLISALGTNKIPYNFNLVDLKNKFGLQVRSELVPVETKIDKYGHLRVVRADEWGEAGKIYVDPNPWWKKIFLRHSLSDWVIILFLPHMLASSLLCERMSLRLTKIVSTLLFLGGAVLITVVTEELKIKGWYEFGYMLFWLYISAPIIVMFGGACLSKDKL